ncbi:MAG: hypothetical protein ABIS92_01310 [Polyangia bacterium]
MMLPACTPASGGSSPGNGGISGGTGGVTAGSGGRSIRLALAVATFLAARVVLGVMTHDLSPARVTSSAVLKDDAAFAPYKVVDRSTVETFTLHNYWLLPDATPGWIRLDFDGERRLDRVEILNTRGGLEADRKTKKYRIELIGPGSSPVIEGELPAYPEWRQHSLAGTVVSAVVVHLDTFVGKGGGLNEIAVVGSPAHGLAAQRDRLLALLLSALMVLAAARLPDRWRAAMTRPRCCFLLLGLLQALIGIHALRFSTSVSSLEWNLLFNVAEFDSLTKVRGFFANLMVPIPPALALLEIVTQSLTGTNDFVIRTVYKVSIIGAYLGALALAYPRTGRMLVTFFVSLLFMLSTVYIHPGNPQLYDTVFPFLVMLFLVLLNAALVEQTHQWRRALPLAAAGLCLSLLALTRPFANILVVAVVVCLARRLPGPRRHTVIFALCAAVLCVPWQIYVLARHGQVGISNNGGFNLHHAWSMVPPPPLVSENASPPYRGANNPMHIVNANRFQAAILRYAVTHPAESLANIAHRVAVMTEGRTVIMDSRLQPRQQLLRVYQLVVRFLALLLLYAAAQAPVRWAREWIRRRRQVSQQRDAFPTPPTHITTVLLVGITAGSLIFLALGEAGEEARFLISLLPMLAVTPRLSIDYPIGGASD